MALPRSAGKDIQNKGNDDFQQGASRFELANIYDSLQERGDDVHPYNTVRPGSDTTNTGTNNVDRKGHSNDSENVGLSKVKIELSCKAICLGLTGILLCCTLICAISGVIVYHVINAKMAESGTQTSQGQDMSSSTNITDALAMDINSLKDEFNKLSNNQSESRGHLETINNVVQLVQKNQTSSAMDINSLKDEFSSLSNNQSESRGHLETINNVIQLVQKNQTSSAMDMNSLKDEFSSLSNNQSESRDYLETINNVVQMVQINQNASDIASRDYQLDNNRRLQTLNKTLVEVQEQQQSSGRQVAFTVHSPTGTLVDLTPTFRVILMNEGGAYNTSTGRFTCPVQGVYLFTLTLLTVDTRSSYVYCYVYQNIYGVTRAYSYEGVYDSASITTFLHLSVGDVVYLSCDRWQNVNKHLNTLYSGSLIRAD